MKKLLIITILINFSAYSQTKIDLSTKESKVFWKGNNFSGYGGHEGTLQFLSGNLVLTTDSKIAGGSFIIDMNSIKNTDQKDEKGQKNLEEHLKNSDFFDVKKFPLASFTIVKIESTMNLNNYIISGNMVIKGMSNRISFLATITQNKELISAKADFTINRTAWGITYKSQSFLDFGTLKNDLISNEIPLKLDLIFRKTN